MSETVQQGEQPQNAQTPPEQTGQAPTVRGRRLAIPGLMQKKTLLVGIVIAVVVVVVAAAALGGGGGALGPSKPAPPAPIRLEAKTGSPITINGDVVPEGQTVEQAIDFGGGNSTNVTNIYEVTVRCTWTDGMSESRPDTMTFTLSSPDGQNATQTTEGMSGQATLTIKVANITDSKIEDNSRGWKLSVKCEQAGDDPIGPIGFFVWVDPGNDWSATVDYKYYGRAG